MEKCGNDKSPSCVKRQIFQKIVECFFAHFACRKMSFLSFNQQMSMLYYV